jgi:hypothetical protein
MLLKVILHCAKEVAVIAEVALAGAKSCTVISLNLVCLGYKTTLLLRPVERNLYG